MTDEKKQVGGQALSQLHVRVLPAAEGHWSGAQACSYMSVSGLSSEGSKPVGPNFSALCADAVKHVRYANGRKPGQQATTVGAAARRQASSGGGTSLLTLNNIESGRAALDRPKTQVIARSPTSLVCIP